MSHDKDAVDKNTSNKGTPRGFRDKHEVKADKRAEALRANLMRRKSQQKARTTNETDDQDN